MFPPFAGITYYRAHCHAMHRHAYVCIVFTVSSPFSPVDYETDAAAVQFDYGVDDPSYLPEQPGKPPP